jgi:aryl-alcohol dehydrogenase-like predicted oxidoreductase
VHGHDPACRALGVALTAYGLLGRGLISGHWRADRNLAGARYAPQAMAHLDSKKPHAS